MIHELRIWPENFEAILSGRKRHEVRKADRVFRAGHEIQFLEWNYMGTGAYTGRELKAVITNITSENTYGLPPDICVFSFELEMSKTEPKMDKERRERISTSCLPGLIMINDIYVPDRENYLTYYAQEAIRYADALIAELDKEPQ